MESIVGAIVDFFNTVMPKELTVLLISMMPILELRGGMIAAALLNVDRLQAFAICLVGTLLPIPFILLFLKQILNWMRNTRLVKLVRKLEEKAEKKSQKVNKYKMFGMYVFVAIPLPGTGAWTGALVATFLDMPFKNSMLSIALGSVTANVIMSLLSYDLLGAIL